MPRVPSKKAPKVSKDTQPTTNIIIECPVCLEDLDNKHSIKCGQCKGLICLSCFKKMDKCPLCRKGYEQEINNNEDLINEINNLKDKIIFLENDILTFKQDYETISKLYYDLLYVNFLEILFIYFYINSILFSCSFQMLSLTTDDSFLLNS